MYHLLGHVLGKNQDKNIFHNGDLLDIKTHRILCKIQRYKLPLVKNKQIKYLLTNKDD